MTDVQTASLQANDWATASKDANVMTHDYHKGAKLFFWGGGGTKYLNHHVRGPHVSTSQ